MDKPLPPTYYSPIMATDQIQRQIDRLLDEADGRYQAKNFPGEGGKKKLCQACGNLLDQEVAFALFKTQGLDEAGRSRTSRKAQAMGRPGSHTTDSAPSDLAGSAAANIPLSSFSTPVNTGKAGYRPELGMRPSMERVLSRREILGA